MSRTYYAIEHRYGATVRDGQTGEPIGHVEAFACPKHRADWIAERRTDYVTQGGYRQPISARSAAPLLREQDNDY